MTREEANVIKKERNRQMYAEHREEVLAKRREYYRENRDFIRAKYKATHERIKSEAKVSNRNTPPSTAELEAALPYIVRRDIKYLRKKYLEIHITKRPPYEEYLRQKTIEYQNKDKQ